MKRRKFLTRAAAALAAQAQSATDQPLPSPPVLDVSGSADTPLEAIRGRMDFGMGGPARTLWDVTSDMMSHPFHVHGTTFTVLSRNRRPVPFEQLGAKDVVPVEGTAEMLVHFTKGATRETPYMFHCHILEHEDGGMMGQFTVS
jgi:hypothetical protein